MRFRNLLLSALGLVGTTGIAHAQDAAKHPGLFGTSILDGWSKEFDLGLVGTSGNSDSLSFNTGLKLGYNSEKYRSELGARYFLSNNNGDKTRNEARVYGNVDWTFPGSRWFLFTRAQYDYDEFQAWENRASFYFGPGYELIKKDNYELIGRAGVGFTQEFGNEDADDFRVEAFLGLDGKWKVADNQNVIYTLYYYPSLEDNDDGRTIATIAYDIAINQAKGINLRLGLEHEYEFRTLDDSKHSDWKYFANILVKF